MRAQHSKKRVKVDRKTRFPAHRHNTATGKKCETRPVKRGPINRNPVENFHPILTPCTIVGPDGKERPGWELHIGERLLGRADTQDVLVSYYTRLTGPLPSAHWKEQSRSHYPKGQAQKIKKSSEGPELTFFSDIEEDKELETSLTSF